jgi:hypothetical protein
MKGSGYNLYISDIFVSGTRLSAGTYHSDTTTLPNTFLPGRDYEGTPHGIYILQITDDKISRIQIVDSGSFVMRNDSILFTLYYQNAGGYTTTYEPLYPDTLIQWPNP